MSQTLTAKFQELHAERERTWEPAKLQKNIDQRAALVRNFDAGKVVRIGDKVLPFSLHLSTDRVVDLDELTTTGPVALVFFRFAGCPACNIALPHYDETLRPALKAEGIRLVAVSPISPNAGWTISALAIIWAMKWRPIGTTSSAAASGSPLCHPTTRQHPKRTPAGSAR